MYKREAWTYTKWITALSTGLYFGIVLFCVVAWVIERDYPGEILQSVSVPFMAVIGGYFGKSLFENKWKNASKEDSNEI